MVSNWFPDGHGEFKEGPEIIEAIRASGLPIAVISWATNPTELGNVNIAKTNPHLRVADALSLVAREHLGYSEATDEDEWADQRVIAAYETRGLVYYTNDYLEMKKSEAST